MASPTSVTSLISEILIYPYAFHSAMADLSPSFCAGLHSRHSNRLVSRFGSIEEDPQHAHNCLRKSSSIRVHALSWTSASLGSIEPAPDQVGPHFYMKYLDGSIVCTLHAAEERRCRRLAQWPHYQGGRARTTKDGRLNDFAQKSDVRLEPNILAKKASLGEFQQKLEGWNASMLQKLFR